jgi:hypothetical protein
MFLTLSTLDKTERAGNAIGEDDTVPTLDASPVDPPAESAWGVPPRFSILDNSSYAMGTSNVHGSTTGTAVKVLCILAA